MAGRLIKAGDKISTNDENAIALYFVYLDQRNIIYNWWNKLVEYVAIIGSK